MIRRLLVLTAVTVGSLVGFAGFTGTAHAANGNIACAYEADPLHVGLCIGL